MKLEDLKRLEAEAMPGKWGHSVAARGGAFWWEGPLRDTRAEAIADMDLVHALRNNAKLMFAVIDAAYQLRENWTGRSDLFMALEALEEAP